MKRVIFSLLAMVILFGACTSEKESTTTSEIVEVSFSIDVENFSTSRTISDGQGATQLMYAVFSNTGELIISKVVKDNVKTLTTTAGYSMSISLAKGQLYKAVFWAQNPNCNAYTISDDMQLTVNYEGINNDELRDAFYGTTEVFKVTNGSSISVVMKRPFAQVNVASQPFDLEYAAKLGMEIATSAATIQGVANKLDMFSGQVSGMVEAKYSLSAIPDEELEIDANEDGQDETYSYLSMSYILASEDATTHDMSFVFAGENGSNPTNFDGLSFIPIQRNYRTNIVGQILTGDMAFNVKIDPIYAGSIMNQGGLYYNFSEDVEIKNKTFAFYTTDAATFTSDNNNLVTMENVTFSGSVEQIAMGEYRDKGNYVSFTNNMTNVKAENMVVSHPTGITNVEPIDYMAPLFFLRGVTTLTNCKITGTTSVAPDRIDYNGNVQKVLPYDCGVPNKCKATFIDCEIDRVYAWSHSQITVKGSKIKYIRCSTHNQSDSKAHLTIDTGSEIDEIVVSSTGTAKYETIDDKKTLTADNWSPSLIIKAGARVKRLDMNNRPSITRNGVLSVIIEDGAIIDELVNAVDVIPNAPNN